MQAEDFHIGGVQAGTLDGRQHLGQSRAVAAGEDVFGDPAIGGVWRAGAADGVQQGDAVRGEAAANHLEEGIVVADADMFEHADRDDAVEGSVERAIV